MTNLGLIIFSDEEENKKGLKRIYLKIKRFFSSTFITVPIKKIQINEELNIHFIKIKYTLKEVNEFKNFKINRLKKNIYKYSVENSLNKCILPVLAPASLECGICIKNPFSGYFIYTALLFNILEIIADKKDMNIKEFEIGIIQGDDNKLLYSYVKLLSPFVKFITIITNKKKYVQEEIDEIYDETGLSIRLTEDIESGLEGVDIIINLGDFNNFKKCKKIKSHAIVINYGIFKPEEIIFNNIIINSILIKFDNSIESILDKNIISCFTRLELASIIFCHKRDFCTNVNKNNVDNITESSIYSQFLKSGYKITALMGSFQGTECKNLELKI
ncbi:MAG: hypothetical protein GX387_10950 [Clostridium sp.]|jgi:hypothetical protein|nr:hypothetical protein [Clostridium sp.]